MMKKRFGWAALLAAVACACSTANAQVRISQIYGGGGATGGSPTFNVDYIELFNAGSTAVDLSTWAVTFTSGTGAFGAGTTRINLTGMIPANGYYLLVSSQLGTTGAPLLVTADQTASIALSATRAKVVLINNQLALSGTCPTGGAIVDFVGFGTVAAGSDQVNCWEGTGPVAPLTNTTAAFRVNNGCQDSNNNVSDFFVGTPAPRNSSNTNNCTPSTPPSGVGSSSPANQCPGQPVDLFCTVTPGANPTSTGLIVTADVAQLGGSSVSLLDNGVAPDVMAGDGIYSGSATIDSFTSAGNKNVPVVIMDAQARTGNASITVSVANCNLRAFGTSTPDGVCNGEIATFTVAVTPGRFPDSTGIQVTGDLSAVTGDPMQQFFDDGTNGDAVAGDNTFTYAFRVCNPSPGTTRMNVTVSDQQGRTVMGDQANNIGPFVQLASGACINSASNIVVSQIYGGGGNTGGLFRNDFIELHNRSEMPVDVTGWSVQFAFNFTPPTMDPGFAAAQVVPINGIIPAGGYYLIQQSQGADGTQPALPTPDAVGTVTMGQSAGRIAVVRATGAIGTNYSDPNIEDFVGYGTAANNWEGLGTTRSTSNTTAAFRNQNGCQDSNNNNLDFSIGAPAPRNSMTPANVCPRVCTADVDDGTGTGIPDGGVTIDDLLFYLGIFEAGDIRADVDDGSSTGAHDCGVTIDDLLYYLFRFEAGC